jgi:hypothetical protein
MFCTQKNICRFFMSHTSTLKLEIIDTHLSKFLTWSVPEPLRACMRPSWAMIPACALASGLEAFPLLWIHCTPWSAYSRNT